MSHDDVEIVVVEKVKKAEKADWNNENKYTLIITVLDLIQTRGGCDDSNGFKKKEWLEIMKSFNRSAGVNYNKQQLQSQLSILKSAYSTFKRLKENSGFGWNSVLEIPTAPDDVWDNYISSHPDAAKYRKETLPNFEELDQIFSGKCATGNYAMSSCTPLATTPISVAAPATDAEDAFRGNKRSLPVCIDMGDDGDEFPRPTKKGTPPLSAQRTPRKPPANQRAVELLEQLIKREGPVVRAAQLFASECPSTMSVANRLAVKTKLAVPDVANLFLGLDPSERKAYINIIVMQVGIPDSVADNTKHILR